MPTEDEIRRTVLRRCELFKNADESTLQDAARRATSGALTKNQILFRAGDPSVHITLVLRGRIRLTQIGSQGDEIVVRYIGPGELTALVSLFRESPYPVTAKAVEATGILQWTRNSMESLIAGCPRLAMNAMFMMVERLGELQDRFRELATERVSQRVARTLLRLADQSGRKIDRGILIDQPLSRQDLAALTGTTLFSVSRVIAEWTQMGILDSGRERVVIVQRETLAAIAEDVHEVPEMPSID